MVRYFLLLCRRTWCARNNNRGANCCVLCSILVLAFCCAWQLPNENICLVSYIVTIGTLLLIQQREHQLQQQQQQQQYCNCYCWEHCIMSWRGQTTNERVNARWASASEPACKWHIYTPPIAKWQIWRAWRPHQSRTLRYRHCLHCFMYVLLYQVRIERYICMWPGMICTSTWYLSCRYVFMYLCMHACMYVCIYCCVCWKIWKTTAVRCATDTDTAVVGGESRRQSKKLRVLRRKGAASRYRSLRKPHRKYLYRRI